METGILKVLIFRKLVNNFDNDSSTLVTQMSTIKFAMIGFRNCSAIVGLLILDIIIMKSVITMVQLISNLIFVSSKL